MKPLVSVITPSLNQARWLPDALQSVASQTYPRIEHVVMDGGSTDGSIELLEQAGPHVRWWSEPDNGLSHACNKALARAEGDIIGWIASDDAYADRRAVAAAVATFQRHPEVGVVYGHGLMISPTNRVLKYLWAPRFNHHNLTMLHKFVDPSVFIRRSVIPDPYTSEEFGYQMFLDLWYRLEKVTEFRRMEIVAAADRHRLERISYTRKAYDEHMEQLRTWGVDNPHTPSRRMNIMAVKLLTRYRSVVPMARLPQIIDPAFNLKFGTQAERLRLQVATRMRSYPMN